MERRITGREGKQFCGSTMKKQEGGCQLILGENDNYM